MGSKSSGSLGGERLVVYGAGRHGKVVADAALCAGWRVLGFVDEDPDKRGAKLFGLGIIGIGLEESIELCERQGARAIVALGDPAQRKRVFDALLDRGVGLATVIHPSAVLSRSVSVGRGTVILAGAVVNPDASIGENAIVNTSASVDHDNEIGAHVQVAPGVHLGGTVTVGEGTLIGIGASVRNNITIGEWSVVGVGAVVVKDLPARVVAVGNPARVVRNL